MVADDVTLFGDEAGQIGLGSGILAYQEEGGLDAVGSQHFKELGRPRGVGAIVEGEGQLAGALRLNESLAEDLGCGPHRRVGAPAGGQTCDRQSAQTLRNESSRFTQHC